MQPRTAKILALCVICSVVSTRANADGGRVRLVQEQAGYRIAVFTSPEPLRAGPVDISVLVQNIKSGEVTANAHIDARLKLHGAQTAIVQASATSENATNKLLRAAVLDLPSAGTWDVEVQCVMPQDHIQVSFSMEAAPPLPPWIAVWPWFTWPIGAVALFAIHRWRSAIIARRR